MMHSPAPFPWRSYLWALAVIALVALLPVLSVALSGGVASLAGCRLDEGNVHPCVILGSDWGGLLYGMAVMGWFMLVTVPLGVATGLGWAVALLAHLAWHRWRR